MSKEYNEIRYKILKQIKIKIHNCKLMNLKDKQIEFELNSND
jgi:hypothetical protein